MNTSTSNISIVGLPAFNDNYLWLLRCGDQVAVVDPGDAQPVLDYLQATGGTLAAILITHHHRDHSGGIKALTGDNTIPVYGPAGEAIDGLTQSVHDGETLHLDALNLDLAVLAVPGHTAGHLAYYGRTLMTAGALFCGDTLFGAGCGRLFEGTPAQMQTSLARLAALPAETLVYCAHEYTQANLRFALAVEPGNAALQIRNVEAGKIRAAGQPTIPTTIGLELATNPFLRWDAPEVRAAAEKRLGRKPVNATESFAAIRAWKDEFRG